MVEKRPALGRGLAALIPDAPVAAPPSERALEVEIDLLRPNRFQPRKTLDDSRIDELSRSIKSNGIIQPIVVRKADQGYEIIAGERRWRASQRAGLQKVPIVVRDIPEDRMLAAALIENIQREDLNPIEEAQAYRRLADDYHLTQDQISDAVGKERSTVAKNDRPWRTSCGCSGCRTRSEKISAAAPCRWATPVPCSRCPTKTRSCVYHARSCRAISRCARPSRW